MFNNRIYGIYRNSSGAFEIWRTAQIGKLTATWELVAAYSLGDPANHKGIDLMTVFNGRIYVGVNTLGRRHR